MEAAVDDEKHFAALDLDFHVGLAAASQNFLLFDLISMIRSQMERTLSRVLKVPKALPLSLREHVSIVNAIERRDAEAAREAMRRHLTATLKRYHSALNKDGKSLNGSAVSSSRVAAKRPRGLPRKRTVALGQSQAL